MKKILLGLISVSIVVFGFNTYSYFLKTNSSDNQDYNKIAAVVSVGGGLNATTTSTKVLNPVGGIVYTASGISGSTPTVSGVKNGWYKVTFRADYVGYGIYPGNVKLIMNRPVYPDDYKKWWNTSMIPGQSYTSTVDAFTSQVSGSLSGGWMMTDGETRTPLPLIGIFTTAGTSNVKFSFDGYSYANNHTMTYTLIPVDPPKNISIVFPKEGSVITLKPSNKVLYYINATGTSIISPGVTDSPLYNLAITASSSGQFSNLSAQLVNSENGQQISSKVFWSTPSFGNQSISFSVGKYGIISNIRWPVSYPDGQLKTPSFGITQSNINLSSDYLPFGKYFVRINAVDSDSGKSISFDGPIFEIKLSPINRIMAIEDLNYETDSLTGKIFVEAYIGNMSENPNSLVLDCPGALNGEKTYSIPVTAGYNSFSINRTRNKLYPIQCSVYITNNSGKISSVPFNIKRGIPDRPVVNSVNTYVDSLTKNTGLKIGVSNVDFSLATNQINLKDNSNLEYGLDCTNAIRSLYKFDSSSGKFYDVLYKNFSTTTSKMCQLYVERNIPEWPSVELKSDTFNFDISK